LILTLPLTNITPNRTATTTPRTVPMKTHQLVRIQGYSRQNQNGFDTLAQHHEEDEEEEADPCIAAGEQADLAFDFSLSLRPVFIMKTIMVTTKTAATSITQPSKISSFQLRRESTTATAIDPAKAARGRRRPTCADRCADLGEVSQGDADDESGFDAFAERDDNAWSTEKGTAF